MDSRTLKQISEDIRLILLDQPRLRCIEKKAVPVKLTGDYEVRDESGFVQDTFGICVIIPAGYPYGFPILIETTEKIERVIDRHISPKGVACQEMDRKTLIIARYGLTLLEYFRTYVHKFFCWQILYEAGEKKHLEEWSHHEDGVAEFYMTFMNIPSPQLAKDCLQLVFDNNLPSRNNLCPCGNGKKFKRCHEKMLNDLKCIGRTQLQKDLNLFDSLTKKAA